MKTINDLIDIKESTIRAMNLQDSDYDTKILVHMGTCGIAAGAAKVLDAVKEEVGRQEQTQIMVVPTGCFGMCSSEPNVTVELQDKEPILYQHMDGKKMRQVFKRHVLEGEVQTDFALART